MKKNNTVGKILSGVLTVLVALVPAKAALVLTGCPSTTNNNGTETPTPDLPGPQEPITIDLLDNERNAGAELKGELTLAEWRNIANRLEQTINSWFKNSPEVGQIWLLNFFNDDITFVIEPEPNFTRWKTIGDYKTLNLNPNLTDSDLLIALQDGLSSMSRGDSAVDGTIQTGGARVSVKIF